jgi:hypothetical protein
MSHEYVVILVREALEKQGKDMPKDIAEMSDEEFTEPQWVQPEYDGNGDAIVAVPFDQEEIAEMLAASEPVAIETPAPVVTEAPRRRGRQPGSKNKVKEAPPQPSGTGMRKLSSLF